MTDDRYDERPDRPRGRPCPRCRGHGSNRPSAGDGRAGTLPGRGASAGTRRAEPRPNRRGRRRADRTAALRAADHRRRPPPRRRRRRPRPAAEADELGDPEQALAAPRVSFDPDTLHELPDNVYELFRIRDSLTEKIDASTDNAEPGPAARPARGGRADTSASCARRMSDAQDGAGARRGHRPAAPHRGRPGPAGQRAASARRASPRPTGCSRRPTRPSCPTGCAPRSTTTPASARSTRTATSRRATTSRRRWSCAATATRSWSRATEMALDALFSRVAERGWGPYPRSRDEILLTAQAAGADVRRTLRPLGLRRRRRQLADRARSSPTCSRSATGWPGSARPASRPGA